MMAERWSWLSPREQRHCGLLCLLCGCMVYVGLCQYRSYYLR